ARGRRFSKEVFGSLLISNGPVVPHPLRFHERAFELGTVETRGRIVFQAFRDTGLHQAIVIRAVIFGDASGGPGLDRTQFQRPAHTENTVAYSGTILNLNIGLNALPARRNVNGYGKSGTAGMRIDLGGQITEGRHRLSLDKLNRGIKNNGG